MKFRWFFATLIFNTVVVYLLINQLSHNQNYAFLLPALFGIISIALGLFSADANKKKVAGSVLFGAVVSVPLVYVVCLFALVASGRMC